MASGNPGYLPGNPRYGLSGEALRSFPFLNWLRYSPRG